MTVNRLWWEQTEVAWELPFFAEMGLCCEAMLDPAERAAAREQLWAIRELSEEPGEELPVDTFGRAFEGE